MRTAMTRLQSDSDAVFMVMDEIWVLQDRMKGVITDVTNLKRKKLELNVEMHQSSKHAVDDKVREDAVKKKLATAKGELAARHVECTKLRWGRNEMVS